MPTTKINYIRWWLIPFLLMLLLIPSFLILNQEFLDASRHMDDLLDEYEHLFTEWTKIRNIPGFSQSLNLADRMELTGNLEELIIWVDSEDLVRMKQFTVISEHSGLLHNHVDEIVSELRRSPYRIRLDLMTEVETDLMDIREILVEYRKKLDDGFSFLVQAQVILILLLMVLIIIALEDRTRQRVDIESSLRIHMETSRAQEEERNRIALDLHDGIAQELSWMRMNMAKQKSGNEQLNHMDNMIARIRDMAQNLRTPDFQSEFFDDAIRDLVIAAGQRSELTIKYLPGNKRPDVQPEIYGQLYRIIQECLNNARKHAGPCRVFIEIQEEAKVVYFEYRDDGVGFNLADAEGHERLGLKGIRNRVLMLRGEMKIKSLPGNGLTLICRIPLKTVDNG
jgi:signal transduction histidine kinase